MHKYCPFINMIYNSNFIFLCFFSISLALFRMGEKGSKRPSLPVFILQLLHTYELAHKTFWILVLTLLPHCCKIWRPYLVPVPNYWTWTKATSQKRLFFWSNSYKIGVMITSLIEILELPNFGHMTASTI